MKKYWRELGEAYAAMPRAMYAIFTIVCFLPAVLFMPLVWYAGKVAATGVAQVELVSAARNGIKLDASKVSELATLMFSSSPALMFLVESIIVVIFITNALFLLVRIAGYFAKRRDKGMTGLAPSAADA
ncbi:hypothetical protein ABH908_000110 [Pseudomonas frederiksbergensis]|uniref:hypothetical protein n=1 Tax=Pseudomonas TaxID=286 RepID=UPI003D23EE4F